MTHSFLQNARDNIKTLPVSIFAPNQSCLLSTEREEYVEGFDHFDYELNQYGLRYTEPKSDNVLLASGCSITFGQGISQGDIYCEIVSKELGLECVNVALPGTGPDIQIANAYWALQKYKPKVFLYYMSDTERKFFATESGYQTVNPNWESDILPTPLERKMWVAISQKHEWSRYLQIAWSMYPLVQYCKEHNIQFYWKCWAGLPDSQLRTFEWLKDTNDLGNIKGTDKARDNMHPGIESHKEFARRILDVIKI
jgi:hypothetical protein